MNTATVLEKKDLTADLMIMRIKPDFKLNFKPGQYYTLGVDGEERPYSIVSAPHEDYLEFFFELVPEEYRTEKSLTPRLWNLKVGDTLSIRPKAKGTFILDPSRKTHVFVATVTGIAPFVSMLRAYLNGYYGKLPSDVRFYIFHGASYKDEFGYNEELRAVTTHNKEILYRNTVSQIPGHEREWGRNMGWGGDIKRVNQNLLGYFGKYDIQPPDTLVYVCGNEGMVQDLTFGITNREKEKAAAERKPLGQLPRFGYQSKREVFF